jgi:hypothetical protein
MRKFIGAATALCLLALAVSAGRKLRKSAD